MSYVTYPRRSYAAQHFFTALRTLPWYTLPPALFGAAVMVFFTLVLLILRDYPHWEIFRGVTIACAMAGLLAWMIRQVIRIIQVARYYCR